MEFKWITFFCFSLFALLFVADGFSEYLETECRTTAMYKQYSVDDIIKVCGK